MHACMHVCVCALCTSLFQPTLTRARACANLTSSYIGSQNRCAFATQIHSALSLSREPWAAPPMGRSSVSCVWVWVSVWVCLCISLCDHLPTHARAHTQARMHACTHAFMHTRRQRPGRRCGWRSRDACLQSQGAHQTQSSPLTPWRISRS